MGVVLDNQNDTLEFDFDRIGENVQTEKPTKRSILSTLAALFDPLGVVSPVVISPKVIFQELCIEKLEWDDPIPDENCIRWSAWLHDLEQAKRKVRF